jgi:transcriptional regulator with XRE-family HTH domain
MGAILEQEARYRRFMTTRITTNPGSTSQVESLAEFLRTRRARLSPSAVGLTPGRRRRTAGLRREEVAELAGIGASWYTALEQGRDVRPSEEVLINLAHALQLTPAETDHLFVLAGRPAPPRSHLQEETVSPALESLLTVLEPHPAYVAGRRWDALAWNRAADAVFGFEKAEPPYPRNLLWRFFTSGKRAPDEKWEQTALLMAARFRTESTRAAGDPGFELLIHDLLNASEEFRRVWSQREVHDAVEGPKILHHATLGALNVEHVPLLIPSMPGAWLMIYVAAPTSAAALAAKLQNADAQLDQLD